MAVVVVVVVVVGRGSNIYYHCMSTLIKLDRPDETVYFFNTT